MKNCDGRNANTARPVNPIKRKDGPDDASLCKYVITHFGQLYRDGGNVILAPVGAADKGVRLFIDAQCRIRMSEIIKHILAVMHLRVANSRTLLPCMTVMLSSAQKRG